MNGPLRIRFVRVTPDKLPVSTMEAWVDDYGTRIGYVAFVESQNCDFLFVQCPQCCRLMGAYFKDGSWTWGGNFDCPTVDGSLLAAPTKNDPCTAHFFIRDGQIVDAGTPQHGEAKP